MYAIRGSLEPAERILSYLPPAARKEIEMKSLQNKKNTEPNRFASEKDISNITASTRRRRRRRRR
jgi:hypothetical protein